MKDRLYNPFEFDAAANLPLDMVEKVYIEDHNYSRFIQSNRNVFLLGERGSGKSMMLIYNSFKIQSSKTSLHSVSADDTLYIGIHVPCKRPLFNKTDHELLANVDHKKMLSEHYFVLAILHAIADEIDSSDALKKQIDVNTFYEDFEYIVGENLPKKENCLVSLKMFAQKNINTIEQSAKNLEDTLESQRLYTFNSLIIPVLNLLKSATNILNAHFMLMIDDAHDLNEYQIKKINSWVAYRDNTLFSIKVATADVYRHSMTTDFEGSIVDGHDFISINMEKSFQNPLSPFYKLAKNIIDKRLKMMGINANAEKFFPANEKYLKQLEDCKKKVSEDAHRKFKNGSSKQIADYVYKNARVEYFRKRSSKANRPPYSGFDILVHASTGVIRNLLSPCYAMYDAAYSNNRTNLNSIPPKIQEQVLIEQSDKMWTKLREKRLSDELIECTEDTAIEIKNFFECLGDLFTQRLKKHSSEPRVLTFTISGMNDEFRKKIESTFAIARKSLLLYERSGPAKDAGRRETYYVPNRMLWLARGLDPVGQHGRVSLQARDIVASFAGKAFPYIEEEDSLIQGEIEF